MSSLILSKSLFTILPRFQLVNQITRSKLSVRLKSLGFGHFGSPCLLSTSSITKANRNNSSSSSSSNHPRPPLNLEPVVTAAASATAASTNLMPNNNHQSLARQTQNLVCTASSTGPTSTASGADSCNLVEELLDSFKTDEAYKSKIHISDPVQLNKLLNLIKNDGKDKLQVITDFDATLTKSHSPINPNIRCVSSSGVITRSALIPPSISQQFISLYEHYFPIETSPTLPLPIKTNHMIAWYSQTRQLMSQTGITYPKLLKCVHSSNMQLRDGALPLMKSILSQSIPILIFSAGIGNVIEEFLKIQNGGRDFGPDLVIISNFIKFNEAGEFDGYEELLIHPLNKNEGVMKGEGCQVRGYFERLKGRRNGIVIGDQGHDGEMWKGMEEVGGVVKIGFLNEDVSETRLSHFLSIFDVVLVDDPTMKFVNKVFDVVMK